MVSEAQIVVRSGAGSPAVVSKSVEPCTSKFGLVLL
jgi:hypothetical protein